PSRFVDIKRQALPRLMLRTTGRQPALAGEEVAMPTRPLPNDPSLEHLRKAAKRLRDAVRAGDAAALALVREFHPRAADAMTQFPLTDAQLVKGNCVIASAARDRKSTRLNSSHDQISYAVFCLKKKRSSSTDLKCKV